MRLRSAGVGIVALAFFSCPLASIPGREVGNAWASPAQGGRPGPLIPPSDAGAPAPDAPQDQLPEAGQSLQVQTTIVNVFATVRGKHGDIMFVELTIPGFGVALIKEPSAGQAPPQTRDGVPRWIHIVFSVPNPDLAYRALEAKGASLVARRSPNGHIQSFLITDSEGNELEIIEDSPS